MRRSSCLFWPLLLAFASAIAASASPVPAAAAPWLRGAELAGSAEGFADLSAADRRRIAPLVAGKIIEYSFEDQGIPWRIHRGDLAIAGNFDNDAALIVDGSLRIAGSYDDYGSGEGLLIVLGDLEAENVFTWYGLYVRGAVRSPGIVYGAYNDYAFEAGGKVSARAIVMDDHSADYEVERAELELDNNQLFDEARFAKLARLMVPELLTEPGSLELGEDSSILSLWPDYEIAKQRIHEGLPIFRAAEAPESLAADVRLALAAGSGDQQLLAILGRDPLTDRLIAARPSLSPALVDALLAGKDPAVRAWLAGQVTDLGRLGGVEALTVAAAERLVANPDTPEATLAAIAGAADPAIRRTLIQREDLPLAVLVQLSRDREAELRAGALFNFDNAERLPAADLARLAADGDAGVRAAAAAGPLPYEIARKLAGDESREVRLALAYSLARQIDLPFPALTMAQREELAARIFADDPDAEVAARVFVALPAARQAEIYRDGARPLDWPELAQSTRSQELIAALLEKAADDDLQMKLAGNLALPRAAQLAFAERALAKKTRKCEDCFGYSREEDIFAELLQNPNLTPEALEKAKEVAALRPGGNFAEVLGSYVPMTPEDLAAPLPELAEKSRSGSTYVERSMALDLYRVRKQRSW